LMELGATLCSPKRPKCLLCPLERSCAAAKSGEPERFPLPRRKRETVRHRLLVAVAATGGRVLLFRRPADSPLLAGTWELPWLDLDAVAGPEEEALAMRYGGAWSLSPEAAQVRHGITYRDLAVEVRRASLTDAGELQEGAEAGWFDAAGRAGLPLSSLVAKVLRAVGEEAR
ncbi:MAG TPA: NUDIX domain-containing protein, partial [Thermoanaerobaculia bacterium]